MSSRIRSFTDKDPELNRKLVQLEDAFFGEVDALKERMSLDVVQPVLRAGYIARAGQFVRVLKPVEVLLAKPTKNTRGRQLIIQNGSGALVPLRCVESTLDGESTGVLVGTATFVHDGENWYAADRSQRLFFDASLFGASVSAKPVENTRAIQTAIDAAHEAYLAGAGFMTVMLPAGVLSVAASVSSELIWDFGIGAGGVSSPASTFCLLLRDGVRFVGQGIGRTVIQPMSSAIGGVCILEGDNASLEEMTVDLAWNNVPNGGVGAIASFLRADLPLTPVRNLLIRNVEAKNAGGYGLGLQNGVLTHCTVDGFRSFNTGADAIDVKNRPAPGNDSNGICFNDIYVDSFGMDPTFPGQAGIDVRGFCQLSNITILMDAAANGPSGIRFRRFDANSGDGVNSSLVNFYVRGVSSASSIGVEQGTSHVSVSNGVIDLVDIGVWNSSGSPKDTHYVNVRASHCVTSGFYIGSDAEQTRLTNCSAFSSPIGIDNQGVETAITAYTYGACAVPLQTSAGAQPTEHLAACSLGDFVTTVDGSGVATLQARGGSANINVYLQPKGTGHVQFGTRVAHADAPIIGYVEIMDASGALRKLAEIA